MIFFIDRQIDEKEEWGKIKREKIGKGV